MSQSRPNRSGASLRPHLQELVSHVGLQEGKVEVVVHQGSIDSVIIKSSIRLKIPETATQKTDPQTALIHVSEAETRVRKHLAPLVADLIGDYGSLKVNVKRGRVDDWRVSSRHR